MMHSKHRYSVLFLCRASIDGKLSAAASIFKGCFFREQVDHSSDIFLNSYVVDTY